MHLFDLDGTLIDSNQIWVEVDKTFLARRGLPYTAEYAEGVAHTIFPLAAKFTKAYGNLPESEEAIMAEWLDLARGRYASVPRKPFVRDYLDSLRTRGERMAVFTSCLPDHCRTALAHCGLSPYFERVVFAQELGLDKSTPEAFRRALDLLGVRGEDCVFYDDSVRACRSAKAVGMTVFGVYDAYFAATQAEMHQVCDRFLLSFAELL